MMAFLEVALGNLLSPMVLFFLLGVAAALLRSDLEIPPAVGKALSLYLMLAIGFKGGVEIARSGFTEALVVLGITAVLLSFLMPVLAYGLLRVGTRLDGVNAAAVAAHYGSVSVVTFVAASAFLTDSGVAAEGYFVALLALMESPAIITGLLIARSGMAPAPGEKPRSLFSGHVLREVLVGGSVLLLVGSLLIGMASGEKGMEAMAPFVVDPFKGILAVFLLDMGLIVARRLRDFHAMGPSPLAFGLYMPLIGAALGLALAWALGLDAAGGTLLAVLAASASYIAVPAAMRQALPEANPSIYVTLSLAITFPFNVVLGIPLYYSIAQRILPA